MIRTYTITDEGDEVQLQLFEDEIQMGGAVFPDMQDGDNWDMALELAESWIGNVAT
jgi:hypothetical protein